MSRSQIQQLRDLEGHRVGLAIAGGARIDDCELISSGRSGVDTVWVFTNGEDVFVPLGTVVDVWASAAA